MRAIRVAVVLSLLTAAWSAAADVGMSFLLVERNFQMHGAAFDASGPGEGVALDFGAADWRWRPEVTFFHAAGLSSDDGQQEYALGLARLWGQDKTVFRLSGGIAQIDTFDGSREAWASGAYLRASLLWLLGARFSLGLTARALEGGDVMVSGEQLAVDYSQFGMVVNWRLGH